MKDETEQDHMNAKNFILKFLEKYGLRSLPYALMGPVASMMNDYAEQQTKSDLERLREEQHIYLGQAFNAGRDYQRGESSEFHGGPEHTYPDFKEWYNKRFKNKH